MSTIDLDEIDRLVVAATEGPWEAYSRDVSGRLDSEAVSGLGWEIEGPPEPRLRGQFARGEDAILMARSRTLVPALVAALREAREAHEDLKKDFYHLRSDFDAMAASRQSFEDAMMRHAGENERLRATLEWYADPARYDDGGNGALAWFVSSPAEADAGERARAALGRAAVPTTA